MYSTFKSQVQELVVVNVPLGAWPHCLSSYKWYDAPTPLHVRPVMSTRVPGWVSLEYIDTKICTLLLHYMVHPEENVEHPERESTKKTS